MLLYTKQKTLKWASGFGIDVTRLAYRRENLRKSIFKLLDSMSGQEKIMVNIGGGAFYRRHWKTLDYASPDSKHYDWIGIDINFDLMSGVPLPFNDNAVDFIYSAHTLEHLSEATSPGLFRDIYRCLKPGGAVRLTMPDFNFGWERFREGRWNELRQLVSHVPSDKFRAAVTLYGTKKARRLFAGWPEEPPPPVSTEVSKAESARLFLEDFANYFVDKESFDVIWKNIHGMTKEAFAYHYTNQIPQGYRRQHPEYHSSWWTADKASNFLQGAGFPEVYESQPFQSRFAEMRGVGKYWGFDYQRPHSSIYVEAVK